MSGGQHYAFEWCVWPGGHGDWDPHGNRNYSISFVDGHVANHKLFIGKGVAINNGGDPSWLNEVDFTNGGGHKTNISSCAGDGPYLYFYGTPSVFPP